MQPGRLFLVVFSTAAFVQCGHVTRQQVVDIDQGLVDTTFTDRLLFVSSTTHSLWGCSLQCLGHRGCLSVTFTSGANSTSCRGHSAVMTSQDVGQSTPGSQFFSFASWVNKECDSDVSCPAENSECFAGRCLCTPGYYFSLSRRTCVAACNASDLQAEYLAYPARLIGGYNIDDLYQQTLQQCVDRCTANALCRTVEYDMASHWCYIQKVTALDVPGSFTFGSTYFFYHRCCV